MSKWMAKPNMRTLNLKTLHFSSPYKIGALILYTSSGFYSQNKNCLFLSRFLYMLQEIQIWIWLKTRQNIEGFKEKMEGSLSWILFHSDTMNLSRILSGKGNQINACFQLRYTPRWCKIYYSIYQAAFLPFTVNIWSTLTKRSYVQTQKQIALLGMNQNLIYPLPSMMKFPECLDSPKPAGARRNEGVGAI